MLYGNHMLILKILKKRKSFNLTNKTKLPKLGNFKNMLLKKSQVKEEIMTHDKQRPSHGLYNI